MELSAALRRGATRRPPRRATGSRRARRCPRRARARDSGAPPGSDALRVGPCAVLSAQMGRGRLPSRPAALTRGFRVARAGGHETGSARFAGDPSALWRLSVRARSRSLPRPWNIGNDRAPHGIRHRPQRLGCDRQRACPHPLGHGIRPGDTVFIAAIFSLYMGSWGALQAQNGCAPGIPVRRRRPRYDRARGDVARSDEAQGLLLDAVVRAASRRGGALGRLRPARVRIADDVFFRRTRGVGARACATASPGVRCARHRLRLDGRGDAVHEHCGHRRDRRHAAVAGHRLHRSVRSADVSPRPVR